MRSTILASALVLVVLAGCTADNPLAVQSRAADANMVLGVNGVADISGTWRYSETSFLVVKPEGEVIHITCISPDGVLVIEQTGSTFTGTLTHPTSNCETKAGDVVPAPWDLPYEATLSGRIAGGAIHFLQQDAPPGPPIECPKHGTVKSQNGVAVELRNTGRCDLSFLPFPAVATNSARATRQ